MRMLVFVVFIMWCIAIVSRLVSLFIASYPRTNETSIGSEVARLMITTGFTVWAGFLLWWKP